jgi:hypothetical protein
MSELKVNKISPRSGTAITLGDSGDTFTIPSGATLAIAGSVTGFTSAGIDDNATSVAITIDSSERVGIGNTSPTGALDVKSGTQPQLKVATASATADRNAGFLVTLSNSATPGSRSAKLSLDSDGGDGSGTDNLTITKTGNSGDATITNESNANIVFGTNNAEKVRITSTGLVGIGTSSPSEELEVSGAQNTLIKSKTTTSTALGGFEAHSSGGTSYIKVHQLGPSFGGTTFGGVTGNDQSLIEAQAASSLAFTTQGGSSPDIIFAPARTARMTIKNGGDVGIGETTPLGKLHVKSADSGASANSGHNQVIAENSGNSGMTILSGNTSNGAVCFGDDGNNCIGYINYSHNGNSLDFGVNGSEKMRITDAGRIGIGSSSPGTNDAVLIENGQSYLTITDPQQSGFKIKSDDTAVIYVYDRSSDALTGGITFGHADGTMDFKTNGNNNRMRITSGGQIWMRTTSTSLTNATQVVFHPGSSEYGIRINSTDTSGTQYHLSFDRGQTQAGYITSNSATTIAVNNSSDERLKENIENSGSALQDIKDLKVRQFDWKDNIDTHRDFGFVAQELHSIIPEAVSVGSDELDDNGKPKQSWGVDYSHIVPRLVKAVQEQQTKIEELEAEVTALKNQPQ